MDAKANVRIAQINDTKIPNGRTRKEPKNSVFSGQNRASSNAQGPSAISAPGKSWTSSAPARKGETAKSLAWLFN